MAKRKVIKIIDEKCTGCGRCIPNCPEGALQLIDNKARLISDLFCDGLGACIGTCPENAIIIEEREAEPYDERKVMINIIKQGDNTIRAHLKHLRDHGETDFLNQAIEFLKDKGLGIWKEFLEKKPSESIFNGCPGMKTMDFRTRDDASDVPAGNQASQLRQWPVQLHLLSPQASYFKKADVVMAADCVAFALGDFHSIHLKGKSLAIACPKLDSNQHIYTDKIRSLIDDSQINTLTVIIMEVPCCMGLMMIAQEAVKSAKRKIPLKCVTVSIQGNVLSEDWITL